VLFLPVFAGLLPLFLAVVLRELINELDGDADRSRLAVLVALSFVIAYLLSFITPLRRVLDLTNDERLEQALRVELLEKTDTIDFAYFEQPQARDRIDEAFERPGSAVSGVLTQRNRSLCCNNSWVARRAARQHRSLAACLASTGRDSVHR